MVDSAPGWLRGYLSDDVLDMKVAAIIDLSHSRVTDADLVHILAFGHFGDLNLSDTAITNAGLTHLRNAVDDRFVDLSRTQVDDVSVLFANGRPGSPSGLKLSGNRIAGLFPFKRAWCPLQELDLSHTSADDGMLESLPKGLVNLNSLDLTGTNVTDDGLESPVSIGGVDEAEPHRHQGHRGGRRHTEVALAGDAAAHDRDDDDEGDRQCSQSPFDSRESRHVRQVGPRPKAVVRRQRSGLTHRPVLLLIASLDQSDHIIIDGEEPTGKGIGTS